MKWQTYYDLGIESIDAQHKTLVQMITQLEEAKDRSTIELVFKELADYIDIHFEYEEQLLKISEYAGYIEHIKHHKALVEKIVELRSEFLSNPTFKIYELTDFLVDWLNSHILTEDIKYVPSVIGK